VSSGRRLIIPAGGPVPSLSRRPCAISPTASPPALPLSGYLHSSAALKPLGVALAAAALVFEYGDGGRRRATEVAPTCVVGPGRAAVPPPVRKRTGAGVRLIVSSPPRTSTGDNTGNFLLLIITIGA
jgi:hypothetical protein